MPEKKSVRSFSIYESAIRRLGRFRVTHPMPDSPEALSLLGFSERPAAGDQILPGSMGRFTDFNANGRIVVRRDLPKAPESYMSWRQWTDWHGNQHSGIQHRTIDVYQKQRIPAPFEYLTVESSGLNLVLCSRILSEVEDSEASIVHILNLFLEIFQGLDISSIDLTSQPSVKVRRLHWKILPAGPYPFERAKAALSTFLGSLDEEQRKVVEHRVEHITQHDPDFMALGLGGFRDYVVFGFPARGLYVLESPNLGNATYIFREEWEKLSQSTKKIILEEGLHADRIIHNHHWTRAIRDTLRN